MGVSEVSILYIYIDELFSFFLCCLYYFNRIILSFNIMNVKIKHLMSRYGKITWYNDKIINYKIIK